MSNFTHDDAADIRRRIAELLERDADQPLRRVAAALGVSPTTVLDVRNRLRNGEDPVPPRLRRRWQQDPIMRADADAAAFAAWFDGRSIADADWERFIDTVPTIRLFQVIDEARRRAQSWELFATALRRRLMREADG